MPFPQPPQGYPTALRRTTIPAGTQWWRIQHCRHASALFWGRQQPGRWHDPDGCFGVLHALDSVETVFAETFGCELMNSLAPGSVKFLSRQELAERCVARLWAERNPQMLDFTGPALQALNLDALLLHSCDELDVCQHWARWGPWCTGAAGWAA